MSRPASVFIDDTLVTLEAGSLSVDNRIEERSTASFIIIDLDASLTYQRGQVVVVYEGETGTPTGTKLFAGFIETPHEIRDGSGLLHEIECKDNHYLADKRLVIKSYSNKTLAYIINDIITDYLAAEGITAGTIHTGPTISEAIFNYVSVTQCFDALKELSGFTWYIDEDKALHFIQRDTNASPWALTYLQIVDGSAHLSKGNPAYRNKQYVRGGTGLTAEQTENFTGDAVTVAFTVGYPIAQEPSVEVDSVAQDVGIKGLDSGEDCYWNKGDATITFATAPGNGLAVQVVYYGQYPLIAMSISGDIANRQAIEGGTGIVEEIIHEAQHESATSIGESARTKLLIYCQNTERFSFQTRTAGLKPGQLLTVTYSPFGFSSHKMLIESVEITEEDSTHLIYSIVAITGPVLGSWSKFFSNILTRQDKSIKIGDERLLVLLQTSEILSLTETTSIAEDEFTISGEVNRWLNSPPIDAGSLQNIQHERLEMAEVGSEAHYITKKYIWGPGTDNIVYFPYTFPFEFYRKVLIWDFGTWR